MIAGMDELGGQQANQLIALAAVHPAQRRVDLRGPAVSQVTDDHAVGDRLKDRPVLLRHLRWAFLVRRALLRRNPQVPSRRAFMQASAPRLRHLSHPPAANDRREDRRERRCASRSRRQS
jgi:hypothetical protein